MTAEEYIQEVNRVRTYNRARSVARQWHSLGRWRRFWLTVTCRRPKVLLREFPTTDSIGEDEVEPDPPWASGYRVGERIAIRGRWFVLASIGPAGMALAAQEPVGKNTGRKRVH